MGDYHGFDSLISTNKTGIQEVYIYALNIAGGTNTLLGNYTVEITTEVNPIISNVEITNIHSNGYTITCTVTDDSNAYKWNDYTNNPIGGYGFICEIDLPYTKTSVTDCGSYKLCKPELFNIQTPYSVIVSSYKNNQLISCEARNSSDNNTYVLLGDIDMVKVMVWDSLSCLMPLCNVEVISSNEFIKE